MDSNGHLQTLVVKLGGTEGVDFAAICQDVVTLQREGWRMVLVHGGSAEANALGEALGHPPRFVTSPQDLPRVTPTAKRWKFLPPRLTGG